VSGRHTAHAHKKDIHTLRRPTRTQLSTGSILLLLLGFQHITPHSLSHLHLQTLTPTPTPTPLHTYTCPPLTLTRIPTQTQQFRTQQRCLSMAPLISAKVRSLKCLEHEIASLIQTRAAKFAIDVFKALVTEPHPQHWC
jgi:hypothetical protein